MTLRTLTDAASAVRAAHSRVEAITRDLNAVKAQKMALEEELASAATALADAQERLNKMAVYGEQSAA